MPTTRKLSPDELDYLQQQGIDTTKLPDQVDVLSPDEAQQVQARFDAQQAGVMKGGVVPTLKSHAGSLIGGGLAGTAAWGTAALAAPETGGASFAIPLIASLVSSYVGSQLGNAAQKDIVEPKLLGMTPEQQAQEEQNAAIAREIYPKSSVATDVVGGILAGGGKPSFRAPVYAIRGLKEGLANEGLTLKALTGSTSPVYKQAVQNVVTGGALNTAINAGVQLTQTGTIDPTELATSSVAGALFSEPSIIGRKLNPHWKPLGKAQPEVPSVEEGITPDGTSIADVEAYRKKAQVDVDSINRQNDQFRQQRDAIQKLSDDAYDKAVAAQQQQDKIASDWRNQNWLSKFTDGSYLIGDKPVQKEYLRSNRINPQSESRPEQQAIIKQHNENLQNIPVDQMRQELFERDYPLRDPQGYQEYKQQKTQDAQAAIQRASQIMEAQRAAEARQQQEEANAQQRVEDFPPARAEQQQQQIQEATAQLPPPQQGQPLNENQRRIINTKSIAQGMMGNALSEPREGGQLFQEATQQPPEQQTTSNENDPLLQREAGKAATIVGNIQGELRTPQGNLARGVSYDPNELGRRLIGIARENATTDTGYHELVHTMLRDLDRSGDPHNIELANSVRAAYGGEEPAAQAIGQRYQKTVAEQAKASLPKRVAQYFNDVWSATRMNDGTASPEDVGANLVRRMRQRHGEQDTTMPVKQQPVASLGGGRYQEESVYGEPDNKRIWNMLRHKLYEGDLGKIAAKEMLQNAHDAVMALPDPSQGRVHIDINPDTKQIRAIDNGVGMSPEVVKKEFISPGRTTKGADEGALGKFGIAKVAYLGNSKEFELETVANTPGGKVRTTLSGTGEDLLSSFNKEGKGLKMVSEPVGEDTPTGSSLRVTLTEDAPFNSSQEYQGSAAGYMKRAAIMSKLPYQLNTTYQGQPHAASIGRSQGYETHNQSTSSAHMEFEHSSDRNDTQYPYVHVLGNGLYQFSYNHESPAEAKFPSTNIVNVRPRVGTENASYPFNASREALTSEAKQVVAQRMTGLAVAHQQQQGAEYKSAFATRQRLQGTHTYVMDVSGTLPTHMVEELSQRTEFGPVMKELKELHDGMRDVLQLRRGGGYKDSEYGGMGMKGGFYGVNIRGDSLHETLQGKRLILSDIFTTAHLADNLVREEFYKPYEWPEAFAEQLVSTMHHELAHSYGGETWTEGEGLQRELTRTSGTVANLQNIAIRRIAKIIHSTPGLEDTIRQYADKISNTGFDKNLFEKISTSGDGTIARHDSASSTRDVERGSASRESLQRGDETPTGAEEVPNVSTANERGKTSDLDEYNGLMEQIKGHLRNKEYDKIFPLQQQTEGIKNRNPLHPGMPPTEESVRLQQGGEGSSEMGPSTGSKFQDVRFKPTQAAIERIKSDIPDENGERVSGALFKTFSERQQLLGKWWNPIAEQAKKLDQSAIDKVRDTLVQETNEGVNYRGNLRTQQERDLYDTIRKQLKDSADYRIGLNMPVYRGGNPTPPKSSPYYYPTTTEPKVADIFRANQDKGAIKQLSDDFIKQQLVHGMSQSQAEVNLKDMVDKFQGSANKSNQNNLLFYNAAREEAGIPLPKSWQRQDMLRNLEAYHRRLATDVSYYHNVETQPKVMAGLGYKKDPWNNPINEPTVENINGHSAVQAVMGELKGEHLDPMGRAEHAAETLATTAMLGPMTEIHKIGSSIAQSSFSYANNPAETAGIVSHAISNLGKAWETVKKTGAVQLDSKKASDLLNAHLTAAERLQGLSKGLRKIYTLNGLTEHFTKSYLQAAGEYIVPMKAAQAAAGDAGAERLLKSLDPDYVRGKTYTGDQLTLTASEFANQVHGTKDARVLPSWMLRDNEVSAFFKLSNWNIQQTNNFMRNVVNPAVKEGNYMPLIMSTLGTVLGGAVIKSMREKMSGKKSAIPSLSEIGSSEPGFSGNKMAVAYNLMAMSSFAGFAGILSNVAKWPFDVYFKNAPQSASFPADEILSNMFNTIRNVGETVANDPDIDYLKVGSRALLDLVKNNIQLARIGINRAADAGLIQSESYRKNLADRMGELRRYKMVSGLPFESQTATEGNPYLNLSQKDFKKEQDLNKAMQDVQPLIRNIINRWGNNPEVMMEKLKGLRQNQYATMPSLEDTPMAFFRYLKFLRNSQGEEAAQEHVNDFLRHEMINHAKSAMVP